jgi:hypothetical protein
MLGAQFVCHKDGCPLHFDWVIHLELRLMHTEKCTKRMVQKGGILSKEHMNTPNDERCAFSHIYSFKDLTDEMEEMVLFNVTPQGETLVKNKGGLRKRRKVIN